MEKFAKKQDKRSEIAIFITRYVPEFLKHFSGSFMNAIISSTFEITPKMHIVRGSMLIIPNRKPVEVRSAIYIGPQSDKRSLLVV